MAEENPVLHIVVVGFHHKKGCQVEFSYPPLITGTKGENECPSGWKYLPTLALPDGSHNYVEDSVFFNLPSLTQPTESIYGVSCYRQIPVEKLKNRTADVTRSTVQKSVCVLTVLPLYGYIEVKLSLIADAFFDQGDFSSTDILVKAYEQLNACLVNEPSPMRHVDVGISARDVILKWRHKTLLLFKLLLLQRRVVCFSSPVRSMCGLILGIASLHPKLLEKGFGEVACVQTSRPMSPMPDFPSSESKVQESCEENVLRDSEKGANECSEKRSCSPTETEGHCSESEEPIENNFNSNGDMTKKMDRNVLARESSVDTLASTLYSLSSVNPESWSAPIPIFTSGHLCLPYFSLPYMDLLSDPSVLSYVIGTSNILFHQKKNLADIQIDVEAGTVDTNDQELRKQLVLTTEDLRFVDYIIKHVQNPKEDAEGSERWIRDQFQGYSLALLKTAVTQDNAKDCEHFNSNFMSAWKKTQCYNDWFAAKPDCEFFDVFPNGHPFAGTLSVADMKLKIAQTMHNSESGRKLNQAVNTTSRAVGGALSQAKGAFSNWWSSITTTPASTPQQSSQTTNFESEKDSDENDEVNCDNLNSQWIEEQNHQEIDNGNINDIKNEAFEQDCKKPTDGIIEIAKEAEILDTKHKAGEIFTA